MRVRSPPIEPAAPLRVLRDDLPSSGSTTRECYRHSTARTSIYVPGWGWRAKGIWQEGQSVYKTSVQKPSWQSVTRTNARSSEREKQMGRAPYRILRVRDMGRRRCRRRPDDASSSSNSTTRIVVVLTRSLWRSIDIGRKGLCGSLFRSHFHSGLRSSSLFLFKINYLHPPSL